MSAELAAANQRIGPNAISAAAGTRPRAFPTAADKVRALASVGARISTGLDSLDRVSRGGLLGRKLIVFGGAPGAAKTSLLVAIAVRLLLAGHYVAIGAYDEPASGILIRIGQQLGFARDDLEVADQQTKSNFAELLDREFGDRLLIVDGVEDERPLEEVSAEIAVRSKVDREARSLASVLIVDSIQTLRAAGTSEARDKKARAEASIAALKREKNHWGHLVLATSEVSRGAYRTSDPQDTVAALAAFKDSGDIEYAVDLALVMRSVKGESGIVEVTVAKNRLGPEKDVSFRVRMDFARASFAEVTGQRSAGAHLEVDAEAELLAAVEEAKANSFNKVITFANERRKKRGVPGIHRTKALEVLGELLSTQRIGAGADKVFFVVAREPEQVDAFHRDPVEFE